MKPKIVVVKNMKFYKDQEKRLKLLGNVKIYKDNPKTKEEWLKRCKGADIICTGMFGFNTEKLYDLKNVFISVPFVGVEFIDKRKLKENNIKVANAPGCNKEAVAEWIAGMLLILSRNLNSLLKSENLSKNEILNTTPGLFDKKITILGTGNIGTQLGKICEAFGMDVKFFKRGDKILKSVKDADFIVNCLASNPDTNGLLDRKFFLSVKKGAFFISTSRQQIYDISALKSALDRGILAGAADDAASTYIGDTKDKNYKALKHKNILVTPHIAWNSESELRKSNDIMIDNVQAWMRKKPINLI